MEKVPPRHVDISKFLFAQAADGSTVRLFVDDSGEITGAIGTGTDGIVHRFVVQRSSKKLGPESMNAICQYTFYENDQAYCSIEYSLHSNGLFLLSAGVSVSNAVPTTSLGTHWVNYFFDFFKQIIIVNGSTPAGSIENQKGSLPLDHLPTTPSDLANLKILLLFLPVPAISHLFPGELQRLRYFEPLFKAWGDGLARDAASQLQAAGITIGTLSGLQFLELTERRPGDDPDVWRPPNKAIWEIIVWGVGSVIALMLASEADLIDFLKGLSALFDASMFDTLLSGTPPDQSGGGGPASIQAGKGSGVTSHPVGSGHDPLHPGKDEPSGFPN